ncbi:MAG: penicillin-binding protein 2 [Parcubacteria group bacterium]
MALKVLLNNRYKTGHRCSLPEKGKILEVRVYVLFFLIFIFAGGIFFRLYFLQVSSFGYYKKLADNQHSILKDIFPQRGEIFLQDSDSLYPVAVDKDSKMAYAVPREMSDPAGVAKTVSPILGLDENEIRGKLSKQDDMYEVLKHRLNDDEVAKLNDLKLEGIHLSDESYRYYPAENLASQVLGFVGWRDNGLGGRYGVENYFDARLSGHPGRLSQDKSNSGFWIPTGDQDIIPAKNGDGLVLTIDHIIQYETEKILKSAIAKFSAQRGTIIVMEPGTGKIMAMASYPDFNPNNYQGEDMASFRNLAVSDPYECGSIFKTITLASAIDAGRVSPDTTFVDTGVVKEAGFSIKNANYKAYGKQTMTQVLDMSINTGAIFAEQELGNANFLDYAKRFGFGSTTGIDLPGESAGNLANLKNFKTDINFFTASFGQGITVTPMQMVAAYNALASGGKLMKPQIIERIIYPNGAQEKVAPQEVRSAVTQQTANEIATMLRSVVVNGEGKMADVPGYLIGGKTGTAQVASSDSKGYQEGQNIGSFAGFAPVDKPRFTVLVRIDNPKGVNWAESSAAPTWGELMKFLLNYKNIQPTEKYTQADIEKFNNTHDLSKYSLKSEEEQDNKKQTDDEKPNP